MRANGKPVINGALAQIYVTVHPRCLQDHSVVIFMVLECITGTAAGKTFTGVP